MTAGRSRRHGAVDIEIQLLLEAIYLRYQHDFRNYAMASLRRRVRQAHDAASAARTSASCRSACCTTPALFRSCCST